MADHATSIFHSRLFTFRAGGDNGAATTVHSSAVAAVSAPLKAVMEEDLFGGPKTEAVLYGVREEDLLRFCDFCYTNTYTDPYPVVIKPASVTSDSSKALIPLPNEAEREVVPPASKRPRTESPARLPQTAFGKPGIISPNTPSDVAIANKARLHSVFGRVFGTTNPRSTVKLNNSINEDHTNVLIAHAAMYAFATRFEVPKLQALSLGKLRDKLTRFELVAARVADVVALVRWVYLAEKEALREMPELRDLVARYVVSEVAVMGNTDEFLKLLEEGGAFVRDFWGLIQDHLL